MSVMRTRLIRAAAPAPAAGRERSAGARLDPARLTLLLLPLMAIKVLAQADDRTGTELRPPAARSLNATSDAESRRPRTTVVYDRVSDHTRLTLVPRQKGRRFGDRASASLAVSASWRGRDLIAVPESVEFLITAFAPARRGWPLAGPATLKLIVDDSLRAEVPSTSYRRLAVGLTSRGRTELLAFRVSTAQLSALASSAQGKLRVGRITIKLDQAMRDDLRALAHQLTAGYP